MLVHQATVDRLPEELEILDTPFVQSPSGESFAVNIPSAGQITNTEVLEFYLPRSEFYLDFSNVFLYLRLNRSEQRKLFNFYPATANNITAAKVAKALVFKQVNILAEFCSSQILPFMLFVCSCFCFNFAWIFCRPVHAYFPKILDWNPQLFPCHEDWIHEILG